MQNGLEDVVAAQTVLSDVDGSAGRLVIRGHLLEQIAGSWSYEKVLALLLEDFFDDLPRPEVLGDRLRTARQRLFPLVAAVRPAIAGLPLFDAMRALVAELPDGDGLDAALALVAAPAVIVPALIRRRRGLDPVPPDAALGHAADILQMLDATAPEPARAAALDTYLVTVSDHGLNASTFAARVVASTQAGLTSAVLAALGALKGPLHGGAPAPVLDMLDAIGTVENAAPWIETELRSGRRLMGFGHRIYRVRDPRADALGAAISRLRTAAAVDTERLELAAAIEETALAALKRHKPDRALQTNVELYTALLLEALGFPRDCFTAVFAMGRTGGWVAHSREQALHGRLIRPRSLYQGPQPQQAA
jgi:citrate synthase